jgi:hypothetical protein
MNGEVTVFLVYAHCRPTNMSISTVQWRKGQTGLVVLAKNGE